MHALDKLLLNCQQISAKIIWYLGELMYSEKPELVCTDQNQVEIK